MIFELIGSRIVAPYIGTSIYAWTSLIGVILASLSLGYYVGGYIADKKPDTKPLALIIFISATAILISLFLKDIASLFIVSFPVSIELKSILISAILFAPASVLLGMVSPYAVRLRIKDSETAGSASGNLYAISTLGSISGTFLAGFYLIPNLGSSTSLFSLSITLFILSLLLFGGQIFNNRFKLFFIISVIFFASFSFLFATVGDFTAGRLVADIDTEYNRIWVYKGIDQKTKKPILSLATDPYITQAATFTDGTDDLVFDYTKFYRLAGFFYPNPKAALIIGGAAYTYPRDFLKEFKDADLDVVEIDPGMTNVARKYFGLKDSARLSIIHEDGRIFLNGNQKKYDTIFVDAFSSASSVPFQLTTVEAVKKIYTSLNDNGAVLVNVISAREGNRGKFFRAEYATYKRVFPQVYAFAVQNEKDVNIIQNIMLVALKTDKVLSLKSFDKRFNTKLDHLLTKSVTNDLPILTDDFAPVEYYKRLSL